MTSMDDKVWYSCSLFAFVLMQRTPASICSSDPVRGKVWMLGALCSLCADYANYSFGLASR